MTLYFFFGWKESKWEAKIELCLKCDLHLKHWCSFLFSWTHWTCSINWVFLENCFSWKSFFLKIFNHKYYNWIFFSFMNSSNMSTKVFVWCRSETTIDTFWWFVAFMNWRKMMLQIFFHKYHTCWTFFFTPWIDLICDFKLELLSNFDSQISQTKVIAHMCFLKVPFCPEQALQNSHL